MRSGLEVGVFTIPLLIDIVKRERETQAARVLAGPGVTWGHRNNDRLASFKRIAKSFDGNVETHGFSSKCTQCDQC